MINTKFRSGLGLSAILIAGASLCCGTASAAPIVCNSTIVVATGGGFVSDSSLTAGVCVQTGDAVYGDFTISSLPAGGRVAFNLNNVGNPLVAYHSISFNDNFDTGNTYTADYSVEILTGSNLFSALDADFTQTNGTSNLKTRTGQTGTGSIDWTKNGTVGSGPDLINYTPGYDRLNVFNTLVDNGTVSSITDDDIENKPVGVVEPSSMALMLSGAGALGLLGFMRGPRKMQSTIG
jgi:hypothetical protein